MGRPKLDAEKIFFSNFTKLKNGCWKWTREIHSTTGYGRFKAAHVEWNAHRFSFIYHKGQPPHRFHVHHLCENRWCVNPDHLKAIHPAEHVMIGNTIVAKNKIKTHCKKGHEFTKKNTYIYFRPRRMCKTCRDNSAKKFFKKTHIVH